MAGAQVMPLRCTIDLQGYIMAQLALVLLPCIAPCCRLGYDFVYRRFVCGAILPATSLCGHVSEA